MKPVWKSLANFCERISRFGAVVAEVSLVLLLLLVFHEVIVRYLLDQPTLYSVEISEYLLILVAFMAAGWVLQEDRHVNMPSLVQMLPQKVQRICALLVTLIVLLFCSILVWKGIEASVVAFKGNYHSSSLLNMPMWIPYAIIPAGSLILALQVIVQIGKLIGGDGDHAGSSREE